ncbi:hypothetical protein GCM10022393_03970 [Aquimarina addita]|uniref:DUF192 domain-containing protein n=1 Tax=Aquimarina addita TaxID=870485 RepID=A0ABP7X9B4_9FLAO
MKKYSIPLILAMIVSFTFSCKETKEKEIVTEEIKFTKEASLSLYQVTDSVPVSIVNLEIEIADNDYERQTGLMYRTDMKEKQGMLFICEAYEPQSFYMKNTLLPLDIIYIDEGFKIVSFQKNAKPLDESSLPSGKPAKYVLEINAGLADQWKLSVGDSISYQLQ